MISTLLVTAGVLMAGSLLGVLLASLLHAAGSPRPHAPVRIRSTARRLASYEDRCLADRN